MEFGTILKKYLQDNKMTQTEFARSIGAKQNQISVWISGKVKLGYNFLEVMTLAFDGLGDFWLGISGI